MAKSKKLTAEQEQAAEALNELAVTIQLTYGWVASGTNDLRDEPITRQDCLRLVNEVEALTKIIGPNAESVALYKSIGDIASLLKTESQPRPNDNNVANQMTVVVRQPSSNLKEYDGSPSRYRQFEKLFETIIETDKSFSDAEKFNTFRNLVGQHGEQFISGLQPDADGLKTAKSRLKKYFDDPVLVREDATERIKRLDAINWDTTPTYQMRATSNILEEALKAFKDCSTDVNYMNDTVYRLIANKLPHGLVTKFVRNNETNDAEKLVKLFTEEVEVVARVNDSRRQPGSKIPKPATYRPRVKSNVPMNAFATSDQSASTSNISHSHANSSRSANDNINDDRPKVCLLCSGSHLTIFCDQFDANVRRSKALEKGLCLLCLRPGHVLRDCRSKFKCRCGERHASAICTRQLNQQTSSSNNNNNSGQTRVKTLLNSSTVNNNNNQQLDSVPVNTTIDQPPPEKSSPINLTDERKTYFQTVMVKINDQLVRALIDNGGGRSTISERLANQLGLNDSTRSPMNFSSPLADGIQQPSTRSVRVTVKSTSDDYEIDMQCQVVANFKPMTLEAMPSDVKMKLARDGFDIADIDFDQRHKFPVELLIGLPVCHEIVLTRPQLWQGDLYLINTHFGWTVSGLSRCLESLRDRGMPIETTEYVNFVMTNNEYLHQQPHTDDFTHWPTREEAEYLKKYQVEKIDYHDGKYSAGLPWMNGFELADNKQIAYDRNIRVTKTLRARGLYDVYDKSIRDLIKDYAEVAPPIDPNSNNKVYYLPHGAVYRPDKPSTPVRTVMDGSSHAKGKNPVNYCMFKGTTDWNAVRLLTQFRFGDTAVVSDISKAFLRIGIRPEDRDALRFFWYDDAGKLTAYRMTSVPFGTSASPFILFAVLQAHYDRFLHEFPDVVPLIRSRQYVDDTIVTFFGKSTEELDHFCRRLSELMGKAGMQMSKWHSNNLDLNRIWASDEATVTKVLGHLWDLTTDMLSLAVNVDEQRLPNVMTKRAFASILASTYDLIGISLPYQLLLRKEQSYQWSEGYEWDQPFERDYQQKLVDLLSDFHLVKELKVPRNAVDDLTGPNNLVIFCDATLTTFGAVAYSYTATRSTFLLARVKLAKLNEKTLTPDKIPELELKALTLAAQLAKSLVTLFTFSSVHILSDSLINLKRLQKHPNKMEAALAIRIANIQRLTSATYHHVAGEHNIADLLSRGCSMTDLVKNKDWIDGPDIKLSDKFSHPVNEPVFAIIPQTITGCGCKIFHKYGYMMSTYRKVAQYFMNLAKRRNIKCFDGVHEDQVALQMMIRICQLTHFPDEIAALKRKDGIIDPKSDLRNFSCFIDEDGLLRNRTRLEKNINMTFDQKYPFLLPSYCVLSRRIVEYEHQRHLHPGVERTLSGVRERYLILKGRNLVRNVIRHCKVCVLVRAKPESPSLGPLPAFRMAEREPAFTNVGIDLFGPIKAKTTEGEFSGLIVVCATTRAVHLELIRDQKAPAVMEALRRFMARRGIPSLIYSDNGLQLVKIRKQLMTLITEMRLLNPNLELRFVWPLQTALSPWRGGFFERRNRDVKEGLRALTFGKIISPDQLRTALAEVEARLNSRPLFVYNGEFITPAHFFAGRSLTVLPHIGSTTGAQVTRGDLIDDYIKTQRHTHAVWNAWRTNHLEQLKTIHQNPPSSGPNYNYKEGDVVILVNKATPRDSWPIAIITRLHTSPDGVVRTIDVRTFDRNNIVVKPRDVRTVIPLDLNSRAALIEP